MLWPSRIRALLALVVGLTFSACSEQPTVVATPGQPDLDAPVSPTSTAYLGPIPDTPPDGPSLASNLGEPVPSSVIVTWNGLEWVWASPCGNPGCSVDIDVGHDGFEYATPEQWDARPPRDEFKGKCASPWFDLRWDHCDIYDLNKDRYGSSPSGGLLTGDGLPMGPNYETFLVRAAEPQEPTDDPQTVDECKKGGWEQYGFRNQGQCVRFIQTGKDSRIGG